ncbi:MAG: hypothetical protein COA42_11275 [Alteromonadaceae bacterium]|nr:MAG: hypothetical protein COA42_11275 [Alteromonadaceae bacterium]
MKDKQSALTDVLARIGINYDRTPGLLPVLTQCTECPEIEKIDHITFVCPPEERSNFLDRWKTRGFDHHGLWQTNRYPASHIALVSGKKEGYPWSDMVGLSVTDIRPKIGNRPLDITIKPSDTDQTQHVAFNVNADADVEALYAKMLNDWQLDFMTPVLYYNDKFGAGLRQWFTAPVDGFFIEFVQRIPNAQGEPYSGFDPDIIDDLYEALDFRMASAKAS